MREKTVVASLVAFRCRITEGDDVELILSTRARCVYWEQYRPSDAAANQAGHYHDFEQTQEQEAIHRLSIQDCSVRYVEESAKPVEHAFWHIRRSFSGQAQRIQ